MQKAVRLATKCGRARSLGCSGPRVGLQLLLEVLLRLLLTKNKLSETSKGSDALVPFSP